MILKPVAFIFDFDGVIADSISLHLQAWEFAYTEIFAAPLSKATQASVIGMSTKEISELLCSQAGQPQRHIELANLKRHHLNALRGKIDLLPGARDAIQLLGHTSVPFGIASNAPVAFISRVLSDGGLKVATIIGIENSGRPKPHPDAFLACAAKLGIPFIQHCDIVVFEDSTHGLKAAKTAGMFPIGLQTQHPNAVLIAHGARLTCRNLEDALSNGWLHTIAYED